MVYYDTDGMVQDLYEIIDSIPNKWDRDFISNMRAWDSDIIPISMAQYNRILVLYNKYIAVPNSYAAQGRERNYPST